MHSGGEYIASGEVFSTEGWGPTTMKFMDPIANDLTKSQWGSIFSALHTFSARITKEEAMRNCAPEESHESPQREPLPPSDPPSPPASHNN